jgi:Domain of unknown function (DUF4062)
MTPQVRYQVFVSSTYDDLRAERQQATQAILEAGFFPSGMELFPASDDAQWELMKRVIEESDYYIVIVAGRYGSLGPEGISYTEMEYDYAVAKDIPVLGFIRGDVGKIPSEHMEKSDRGRKSLEAFRQKAMSRTCRKYSTPAELGMAVMKSLMAESRIRPRTGWVRADQARSDEDIQRERRLTEELSEARQQIELLGRELRDRAVLGDEVPQELLAQGDDILELIVAYSDESKRATREVVKISWDEMFRVIGPRMYGYILRKREAYGESTYPFQDTLQEHIRATIIDRVQNRKIRIEETQIDSCILQFKELGLLRFAENHDDGKVFRGVTLTEEGERRLTRLSTRFRSKVEPVTTEAQRSSRRKKKGDGAVSRADTAL